MIATEIKKYLDDHGIKQIFLCRKTGLPQSLINESLRNKRKLKIEEYIKICDALEVSYDYFYEQYKKKRA